MVSLRHKAQELNIEKMYLKGGRMNIFFVDGKNKKFYEGELFGHILAYVHTSPFNCQVKEADGRCIITINNVKNVETALTFMNEMQRAVKLGI